MRSVEGEVRGDAERLEKRRCNEGFLNLRVRGEELAERESEIEAKFGSDRVGMGLLYNGGVVGLEGIVHGN
jgi:hypothetical protein